ncbi:hypothetical protein V1505DRAFT_87579 [Lipomyces doorenjongii]
MLADIFTKALPRATFDRLRNGLCLREAKVTVLVPWVLRSIVYNLYGFAPGSPEFAGLEDGFSRGDVGRAKFPFSDEYDDRVDLLSVVRVPAPPLPRSFWGQKSWN